MRTSLTDFGALSLRKFMSPLIPMATAKSTETWAKTHTEHHWYRAPRSSTPNARQMRVSPWDVLQFSRQFQIKLFSKEFLSAQRLNSSSRGKKTRRRRSRHELEQEIPRVSMLCSSSRIVNGLHSRHWIISTTILMNEMRMKWSSFEKKDHWIYHSIFVSIFGAG